MAKLKDRVGERYGRLTVTAFNAIERSNRGHTYSTWKCICDCGKEVIVPGSSLNSGKVRSCGCLKAEENHRRLYNGGRSKLYDVWRMMHKRCEVPENPFYKNYGGRGISVCSEWSGPDGYHNFRRWAESNGYSDGLTLDRTDNNESYCPSNCSFTDMRHQSNNRRSNVVVEINGVKKTLTEWCREYGVPFSRVRVRYCNMHWSIEEALTTPRYGERGIYG